MRLISVAVPVPFLDLLTYSVPDTFEVPPIGARVRVPVGARTVTGCVVEHDASLDVGTGAKEIVEALDVDALLPPAVVDLCRWVAEYYVAGVGDALAVAMPPGPTPVLIVVVEFVAPSIIVTLLPLKLPT